MIEQFLGELHRPGYFCDPSVELTVNEIGAASKEQTDRRGDNQIVAQISPRNFVPVRVVQSKQQQAEHSSVAGHSAFPNTKDRQWLAQHFRLVEEHVAQRTADDHAKQRAASDEVAHSLWGKISEPAFSQPNKKQLAADKSKYVGQTVPARANIVMKPKNNRIEIVQIIGEHCADCP